MTEKKIKLVVLTGNGLRHHYFLWNLAGNPKFSIIKAYCEGNAYQHAGMPYQELHKTLAHHFEARDQVEREFFGPYVCERTSSLEIERLEKSHINDSRVVQDIIASNPDLLICFGTSLIRSDLLNVFAGRFLNVHLGLSPYYRGSGTNIWPLINWEPEKVGVTFMYMDAGVDTGEVIHQIRADYIVDDTPHTIGNRLIQRMVKTYSDIIENYPKLQRMQQIKSDGRYYRSSQFDEVACKTLYENFSCGLVEKHLLSHKKAPPIVCNPALKS